MALRRSIAFPFIGLILVIIFATTLIHYFIQSDSLQRTFSVRNVREAEHIHFTIQSLINLESEKLQSVAYSLGEKSQLSLEISDHALTGNNLAAVQELSDKLYDTIHVDLLEVIGKDGRVLHRAHPSSSSEVYADYWGVEEALAGRSLVSTSLSADGWGVRVFVPVRDDKSVHGAIMLGTGIDDEFASNIAEATGAEISIGSMKGLVATSLPERKKRDTDFKTLIVSLTEDRRISTEDSSSCTLKMYAPLRVVDEVFGFVVEIDTTKDALLLKQNKDRIVKLFLLIMAVSLLVGTSMTYYIIFPLKKLTEKTTAAVEDISGATVTISRGNEVHRLVRAVDLMIQKVKDHLAERKKAENNLINEKERLDITLRSIGDAVISTDVNGAILLINPAAEELTGWKKQEVLGKSFTELYRSVDESKGNHIENPVEIVLHDDNGTGLTRKSLFFSDDGVRTILESGSPIKGEDGRIVGAVLVFRDITEQKKMEDERLKAHQLESLGTLAGGIAHDFNNILTAIMGNASLASMFVDHENKAHGNLLEIEKASLRAKELTQKLLTFSKGGAPVKETARLDELVRESAQFILSGSNTRCSFTFQEGLWAVNVDKGQMSQVIQNICLNASEASRENDIIELLTENRVVTRSDNLPIRSGNYIKFSVTDHGRGISQLDLTKIFDPYFSTKREGGGLGLSIVHSIVERHGGHVVVQSEMGKGTTFTIYLPAVHVEEEIETMDDITKPASGEIRILFMDDEEMLRNVVSLMLESMGFNVELAGDGEEAVALYEEKRKEGKRFDVVILDLTIAGGMGGKDTISKLLAMDSSVRAIVASGYSNDPVMAEYEKFGFRACIKKPFDAEQLKAVIEQVLA